MDLRRSLQAALGIALADSLLRLIRKDRLLADLRPPPRLQRLPKMGLQLEVDLRQRRKASLPSKLLLQLASQTHSDLQMHLLAIQFRRLLSRLPMMTSLVELFEMPQMSRIGDWRHRDLDLSCQMTKSTMKADATLHLPKDTSLRKLDLQMLPRSLTNYSMIGHLSSMAIGYHQTTRSCGSDDKMSGL